MTFRDPPQDHRWCVMHSEPEQLCDYDFFPTEATALAFADDVVDNALEDGVALQVFVMRVKWMVQP